MEKKLISECIDCTHSSCGMRRRIQPVLSIINELKPNMSTSVTSCTSNDIGGCTHV